MNTFATELIVNSSDLGLTVGLLWSCSGPIRVYFNGFVPIFGNCRPKMKTAVEKVKCAVVIVVSAV